MNQAISRLLARITAQRRKGDRQEVNDLRQHVLRAAEVAEDEDFTSIVEALVSEMVVFAHVNRAQQVEPLYRRLLALVEQRLGPEHLHTLKVKESLATIYAYQSRFQEAASLAEQLLPLLIRELGEHDHKVINTIDNLILWYRNAGRTAEADALERERWEHLPVCDHLKPLEGYILMAGGKIAGRGRWGGVVVSVDAYLDLASLRQRLDLAPCVEVTEMSDPHDGYAQGFWCSIDRDVIWGRHPSEHVCAPTIS